MKIQSKISLRWLAALSAVAVSALMGAEPSDVELPAKRVEFLERAAKIQAPKTAIEKLPDPFHPEGFLGAAPEAVRPLVGEPAAAPAGPRSGSDILQAIAANLKPSGYFVIGGQQTLVFGQKRVRAGGQLTVTFEGTEYTLEITAIDRTNFTLRLNREEFTRPIK